MSELGSNSLDLSLSHGIAIYFVDSAIEDRYLLQLDGKRNLKNVRTWNCVMIVLVIFIVVTSGQSPVKDGRPHPQVFLQVIGPLSERAEWQGRLGERRKC